MDTQDRILRLPDVAQVVGISRSQIYAKLEPSSRAFDPDFPRQVRLGTTHRSGVGWLQSEIDEWVAKLSARRNRGSKLGGQA